MVLALVIDVLVVVWILYRQRKVRRVWPRVNLRIAGILAVIGLVELVSYTGRHHVSATVVGVLVLSFVLGAIGLGAVRAATVRIWRVGDAVLRQGTWLTIGLWLFSLALHYGAQAWINALHGPRGLVTASLLLWLGITYGVQNAVVHHRAEGLLRDAGPIDARSQVLNARWWAGPSGGTDAPAGPDAIEAHAEPIPPRRDDTPR
jgi:hypothetical protein